MPALGGHPTLSCSVSPGGGRVAARPPPNKWPVLAPASHPLAAYGNLGGTVLSFPLSHPPPERRTAGLTWVASPSPLAVCPTPGAFLPSTAPHFGRKTRSKASPLKVHDFCPAGRRSSRSPAFLGFQRCDVPGDRAPAAGEPGLHLAALGARPRGWRAPSPARRIPRPPRERPSRTPRLPAPRAAEPSPGRGSAASGACSSPPTRPLPPPSRPLALPGTRALPAAQVLHNFSPLPSAAAAGPGRLAALCGLAVRSGSPGQVLEEQHLAPLGRWRSLAAPHLADRPGPLARDGGAQVPGPFSSPELPARRNPPRALPLPAPGSQWWGPRLPDGHRAAPGALPGHVSR